MEEFHMKNYIGAAILLMLSTTTLAVSITGSVAEQIYNLIPTTTHQQVFSRPMNLKVLGQGYACSQLIKINDADGVEIYQYHCELPDAINGYIRLTDYTAKILYKALINANAAMTITTSRNATIYIRTQKALSCIMQEYIGRPISYKCVIKP